MFDHRIGRREFLRTMAIGGAGLAGAGVLPRSVLAAAPSNKKVLAKLSGAFIRERTADGFVARALSLEPSFRIKTETDELVKIQLRNVWAERLSFDGAEVESVSDNGRTVTLLAKSPAGKGAEIISRYAPPPGEVLNFTAISDTHLGDPLAEEHFARVTEHINLRLPDFVADAGDIIDVDEEKQWRIFNEREGLLKPPLFTTIGNHDSYISTKLYTENLGDLFHGFENRGAQFLFLDNAQRTNDATLNMDSGDPMAQWNWLEKKLALPAESRFAFFHFPTFGDRSMQDKMYVRGGDIEKRIKEIDKMTAMFKKSGLGYVCFGHLHNPRRDIVDGIVYQRLGGGGGSLASHTSDENVNFTHYFIQGKDVRYYTTHLYADNSDMKRIEFCELPATMRVGASARVIVHGVSKTPGKYYGLKADVAITGGPSATLKDGILTASAPGAIQLDAKYAGFTATSWVLAK